MSRRARRVAVALAVALVAVSTVPSRITAAQTPPPEVIVPGPVHVTGDGQNRHASMPVLVATPDGRVSAVWEAYVGRHRGAGYWSAVRDADGVWGQPSLLLPNAAAWSGYEIEATAVGPDGSAYVGWRRAPHPSTVDVAALPAGAASWSMVPPPVPTIDGVAAAEIDLTVDGTGQLVAAWERIDIDLLAGRVDRWVDAARFDGTAWSEPQRLNVEGLMGSSPKLVTLPDGSVLATYRQADAPAMTDASVRWLLVARPLLDDTWGPPEAITGMTEYVPDHQLAVTGTGSVVAVYDDWHRQGQLLARTRTGAGWSAEVSLFPGHFVSAPDIATAPDHLAVVTVAGTNVLVRRFDGTTWAPLEALGSGPTTGRNAASPAIALHPDGHTAVSWRLTHSESGDSRTIQVAVRTPAGEWKTPVTVSTGGRPNHLTDVVLESSGRATVAWTSIGGDHAERLYLRGTALGPPPPPPLPPPFDDVPPNTFFTAAVEWAQAEGYTTGVGGSNEFQPHRPITRAEAVTLLWRIEGAPTTAPPSGFEDLIPGAFYQRAIDWARASGLTTGVGGRNVFEPDRQITRAELVTLIWRLEGSPTSAPPSGFVDLVPGAFYGPAVDWARAAGITTGVGGSNEFQPDRDTTRAETITLLYRTYR